MVILKDDILSFMDPLETPTTLARLPTVFPLFDTIAEKGTTPRLLQEVKRDPYSKHG